MNLHLQRNEMNHGFGDGLSQAFELIVTPAIFGFLGFLIDSRLGITPLFTCLLSFLVLGYMTYKLIARYNADFDAAQAEQAWNRTNRASSAKEPIDG